MTTINARDGLVHAVPDSRGRGSIRTRCGLEFHAWMYAGKLYFTGRRTRHVRLDRHEIPELRDDEVSCMLCLTGDECSG